MIEILTITGPIYIAIIVGFIATRTGLFTKPDMRVLGKFVIHFALPALVFRALAQRQIGEILNITYLLAYLSGSLVVFGIGYLWTRKVARLSALTSTFYVMGMTCSNSGYIGYPVLLLTLSSIAGISLALNMMVENMVMIPLLLALAESGSVKSGSWYHSVMKSFVNLAKNPLIIGLTMGFCVSISGVKLPEVADRTVHMFAMASAAISLFVIGGTLVGLPLKGMGRRVSPIVVGKLILHPIAVLFSILALPALGLPAVDPHLRVAAVMMAAMPMMSIYTIFAQVYGQEELSAAAMLVTTTTSFFTLSGLLFALKHFAILG